jgi:hypothetical protein
MTTKMTTAKQAPKTNAKARKAAKPAKAPANGKPAKKLSQMAAAIQVLGKAREPMTCKDMIAAMTAKGLWTSPAGKTPDATLYASILRDLRKGKDARFVKAGPGRFALNR